MQHVLFVALLIGMPVWDHYEHRALRNSKDPRAKLLCYRRIVMVLWALALVALASSTAWAKLFEFPSTLELPLTDQSSYVVGPIVAAGIAGLILPVLLVQVSASIRAAVARQLEPLDFFLPRTASEKRWWVLVSVTAGLCEEVLYRGFLLGYLVLHVPAVGPLGIVGISAVMFGLAHCGQGLRGIVGTSVLAVVFIIVFWFTGWLWWAMILHVIIDLRVLLLPVPAAKESA